MYSYSATPPVNIYVYRNGMEGEKPQLIHIPVEKKRTMGSVLQAIQTRIKLPMGYPIALYNMDGTRVFKPHELCMYNNYVVVTNIEKRFKKVDYGKIRDPLVVGGGQSKHVNTLNVESKKNYDPLKRRKLLKNKPLLEMAKQGYGLGNLSPTGQNLKILSPAPVPVPVVLSTRSNRPTQCCSDEIMCVESDQGDNNGNGKMYLEEDLPSQLTSSTNFSDPELQELFRKVRASASSSLKAAAEAKGTGIEADDGLVNLIQRYKDVGSEIFRMFQDKIYKDLQQGDITGATGQMKLKDPTFEEQKQRLKQDLLNGKPISFER